MKTKVLYRILSDSRPAFWKAQWMFVWRSWLALPLFFCCIVSSVRPRFTRVQGGLEVMSITSSSSRTLVLQQLCKGRSGLGVHFFLHIAFCYWSRGLFGDLEMTGPMHCKEFDFKKLSLQDYASLRNELESLVLSHQGPICRQHAQGINASQHVPNAFQHWLTLECFSATLAFQQEWCFYWVVCLSPFHRCELFGQGMALHEGFACHQLKMGSHFCCWLKCIP